MRIIGLDIHRAFAEAVAWEDGKLRRLGRVDMRRELLTAFAQGLSQDDVVVVEATGNAAAVAAVLAPHVKKVVIANPKQVRVIAHAKIKTDTIDAGVLAQLYASGFLPEVWIPDEPTQALRRQVTRRNQIVRQRSRLKNIIQSILHGHLIPSCPHADLCGPKGRAWLVEQVVPEDERLAIERHLREFDRLGEDLKVIERDLARSALADEGVKRLMTIPGVDMVVALAMAAAIGDVTRFERAAEAGELPWSEPERPAVGTGTGPPRADHQAGPRPRARHAGRGSLGRGASARSAAGLLPAGASAARPARGGGCDRAQARRRDLASADARARATSGRARRCTPRSCAISSSRPGTRRRAARRAPLTPTTSRATATRSGAGSSRPRRPTPASSPAGTRAGRSGCARAPQPRSDDEGCAAGLPPHALLFATRSPVRERSIPQIAAKSACRSHQSSRDDEPAGHAPAFEPLDEPRELARVHGYELDVDGGGVVELQVVRNTSPAADLRLGELLDPGPQADLGCSRVVVRSQRWFPPRFRLRHGHAQNVQIAIKAGNSNRPRLSDRGEPLVAFSSSQ